MCENVGEKLGSRNQVGILFLIAAAAGHGSVWGPGSGAAISQRHRVG